MTATSLASFAALLADRSRAAICLALLDGRAWTVGELASVTGVAPSTASEHVTRLVDRGMLASVRQGRHRYVRLADHRIAQIVEDVVAFASEPSFAAARDGAPDPAGRGSLRASTAAKALRRARTCYDHLAGRLGVRITDAMTEAGLLDQGSGFALTEDGLRWLQVRFGIDVAAMAASRRPMARACLDWTERRSHLGGAAGAAICERLFAQGWISRIGTARAVTVTPDGERALRRLCGLDVAEPT